MAKTREAIDLLLSAIHQKNGNSYRHAFLFSRPGSPHRNLGVEIYYKRSEMIRAALYVRNHGPSYLKDMPIADIRVMLMNFIEENYWHMANETFGRTFECSFGGCISETNKSILADALCKSHIFQPRDTLILYPLVPVRVEADFDSDPFFFVQPLSLDGRCIPQSIPERDIAPEQFPPITNWDGRQENPSSWLGVRSPTVQSSRKMKAAILGALALTPHPNYRHLFSGRYMFGGQCTLERTATISFGEAHTPPMMEDIIISERDHAWLAILASKLVATEKDIRRQRRALEYFYRAWPLDPSERFPWLFMALDAIFGDTAQATQAVIDAVGQHTEGEFSDERLKRLLGLRASVIHGGAPDVYDSNKYQRYYEKYGDDPIYDFETIAARCLRSLIFGETLQEQQNPMRG